MARMKDAERLSEQPVCIFCRGRSADAVWIGKQTVGVCQPCAIDILPKLIGDAVCNRVNADREGLQDVAERHWTAAKGNFFESIFRNACRILDEWQQGHAGRLN